MRQRALIQQARLGAGIAAGVDPDNLNPTFEDGIWGSDWTPSANNSPDAIIDCVTSAGGHPIRNGSYVMRFQHADAGEFNSRVQVVPVSEDLKWFEWYKEYWVGFSFYMKDWDQNVSPWQVAMGYHGIPINHVWVEPGTGDAIRASKGSAGIFNSDTVFGIYGKHLTLSEADGAPPGTGGINDTLWSIPLADCKNKWIDFIHHFIFSPYMDGIMQWWVDVGLTGTYTKVVDFVGPNSYRYCYPTDTNQTEYLREEYTNMQIGSYKPNDNTATKTMYQDEVRIFENKGWWYAAAPAGAGSTGGGGGGNPQYEAGYDFTNRSSTLAMHVAASKFIGQAYTAVTSYDTTSMKFALKKIGNPPGDLRAKLYATTGTAPNIVPTGSALATSDPIAANLVDSVDFETISFTFSTPYTQTATTKYAAVITREGAHDTSNFISVGYDNTSPTDPLNGFRNDDDATSWELLSNDVPYEVWVTP